MGHVVRREPWGVVDLDTDRGHVFVRQDWQYHWTNDSAVPPWTLAERHAFHHALDRLIWTHWSFRTRVEARGITPAGSREIARYAGKGLTVSFDVRRVRLEPQWNVHVTNVDPNRRKLLRADTNFERRSINLFSTDVTPVRAGRYVGDPMLSRPAAFYVAPHEFGHALGYCYARGDGEEYDLGHPYFQDDSSLMNVGREVRPRHIRLIIETLRQMVPGAQFTATVVQ